jgi:saccharopine dehydrogenase-like NADP-dependent oxidoreductase
MKCFVLGGYGNVGLPTIELLAHSDLVTEIAVAGRNLKRAEAVAAETGKKAVAVQVDGTDEEKLTVVIAGYDIVLNAAYNATVQPTIRAAIRSGVHYCDVSWGDALEPAFKLAPEAKTAGIIAVVATGISPCISNLMGVHVARQLEEVEQLQIGRADVYDFNTGRELNPQDWLKDPRESLVALREFKPFFSWILEEQQRKGLQKALYYQDGGWVALDPLKKGLDVPYLENGIFTLHPYASKVDYWGMLPADLAKVSPVEIWFSHFPPKLQEVLREQSLRMLAGDIDYETAVNSIYDTVESDPDRWLTFPDNYDQISKMWVRALGRKEGRATRYTAWFTASMSDVSGYFLTSVALVAAARLILQSEIQASGVMHAEKAFEPLTFFDEVIAVLPTLPHDGKLIEESLEWLE